ncbi:replication initiation protein [Vibrio sp. S11_S32]|uniref:replication initiation protein n=1 Tax=Vibrio sp. S11_S32 TaxID=2720225 RepID=UPI001680E2EE|nr:replication initiation protein [Vibrio sp. S11_S32]MBD1577901.1 replication initiation protein [Vibrio sp. S11_S32]
MKKNIPMINDLYSSDLTVNQSNLLVTSTYYLQINQLRIVWLALTKVNSSKTDFGEIIISTREFADFYAMDIRSCSRSIKDAIDEINTSPIKIRYTDKEDDRREQTIHWFSSTDVSLSSAEGKYKLRFSAEIKPYLTDLRSHYSKSDFKYLTKLKNTFQFRLYQWLKDGEYIKLDGSHSVAGKSKSSNGVYVVRLPVDAMKNKVKIKGYDTWFDFKRRILDPAVNQINKTTNLSVVYKPIKAGKAIDSVEFSVLREDDPSVLTLPIKPSRPRLKRRPHVTKGAAPEADWANYNIKLLLDYEAELLEYDESLRLEIPDLRRLVQYYEITGDTFSCDTRKAEIKARSRVAK